MRRALAPWALVASLGCQDPAPRPEPAASTTAVTTATVAPSASTVAREPRGDAAKGKELIAQFECNRCHDGTGLEPVKLESHCTHCHQKVMRDGFAGKPDNDRWKRNVAHLTEAPSLEGAGARWRYEWLVAFLLEPHDLRPNLWANMPRLALEREQARDLASYLVPAGADGGDDPLAGADLAHGRKVLEQKGCGTCHVMSGVAALGGVKVNPQKGGEDRPAVRLAPDLATSRERMSGPALLAWLRDPLLIKKDALMPKTPMSEAELRDLSAYLLRAPLEPLRYQVPARLPVLERRVAYAEIAEAVLDVTCRHCHSNPDVAIGDGGPGNTGGFGFKPKGLNLGDYKYVQAGFVGPDGERHSVFEPLADGTPRLVAALWARHRELAGQPSAEVRGMPLGLPPLSADEIQLMESWVAQGRPR